MLGAIAAGIAIPSLIILYFLKLRRRDVEVSTTLLWKKSIEDLQANAPFQKLRRNLLLLLQLLVLAAALIAVAQPQIHGKETSGGKHVILIDNSASSQTRDEVDEDGDPITRLERAKLEALALIESFKEPGMLGGEAEEAMVLSFSTDPQVLQHFTSDKRMLRNAIESIEPTDRPSRLAPAIKLISEYAPRDIFTEETDAGELNEYERPRRRIGTIHVYGDGRYPDAADADYGPHDTVEFGAVGKPETENVGITSLKAGRDFNDPSKLSVFVGLSSNAPQQTRFDLELLIDGVQTEIRTVAMPAAKPGLADADATELPRLQPSTGGVVFELNQAKGVLATVRVRTTDGLAPDMFAVDDRAWLVVPPAKRLSVAIVSKGNFFINNAIAGLPLANLDTFTPAQYEEKVAGDGAGAYDVVVLDGYLPEIDEDSPVGLPPGRFLVFNAVPQSHETMVDGGMLAEFGVVTDWDHNHPALRGLSLSSLYIFKPRGVTLADDTSATVLAQSAVGTQNVPAILEVATAETRALVIPFDVAESNWGFNVSWVVFLGSAMQYLGDVNSSGIGQSIQPGQQITDRIPVGATDVRIKTPDDVTESLSPADDGTIIYGPILKAGTYVVSWVGAAREDDEQLGAHVSRTYASNLTDPEESDIGLTGIRTAAGDLAPTDSADDDIKAPKRLWPWLLLAALAISLIEWYIYNRKVYI
jgi:Aerotolerance regulator N-terminal/von Willebrand factor type A domain